MVKIGRKRIPEDEKKVTLSINLKQSTIDNIAKDGKPKNIVENIINEKYEKK